MHASNNVVQITEEYTKYQPGLVVNDLNKPDSSKFKFESDLKTRFKNKIKNDNYEVNTIGDDKRDFQVTPLKQAFFVKITYD